MLFLIDLNHQRLLKSCTFDLYSSYPGAQAYPLYAKTPYETNCCKILPAIIYSFNLSEKKTAAEKAAVNFENCFSAFKFFIFQTVRTASIFA